MRDLDLIKKMLESKVKDYLEALGSDEESISEDIDFDVTVKGVDFCATVSVNGTYSFEPYYESDKLGISVLIGYDCRLASFDFEIMSLWDDEIEDYIIEDYKIKK